MHLPDGEPRFGPWRIRRIDDVLHGLLHDVVGDVVGDVLGDVVGDVLGDLLDAVTGGPLLLAVDGRSGSGKTTVAGRIARRVPGAAVVHTDDIAWYHAMFDWSALITEGVLAPLRRGAGIAFRPPEWDERARPGTVSVPAGCPLVVVEGVGIGRRDLAAFFHALVWVQADRAVAPTRVLRICAAAEQGGDPQVETLRGASPATAAIPRRRRSGTSGRQRSARSWRPSGRGSARTSSSTGCRSCRTTRRRNWSWPHTLRDLQDTASLTWATPDQRAR